MNYENMFAIQRESSLSEFNLLIGEFPENPSKITWVKAYQNEKNEYSNWFVYASA